MLYIVRSRARFRWGDRLEFVAEAGLGDFIYVPPFVPHQEINAKRDEPVEAVVVRSGQEPIVVNLDIASPEPASGIRWVDPGPLRTPFPKGWWLNLQASPRGRIIYLTRTND